MKRVVVESPLAGLKKTQCKYCGCVSNGSDFCTAADGYCEVGPYGPTDFKKAIRYAQLCVLDCLRRGEAPFASHLLYTQVLDDRELKERDIGIWSGFAWAELADVCAVYQDFGVSDGMQMGAQRAARIGVEVVYRNLPADLMARVGEDPSTWETMR